MNAAAAKFASKINSHLGTSVDVDAAAIEGENLIIYGPSADMEKVVNFLSGAFTLVRTETDDEFDDVFAAFAINA